MGGGGEGEGVKCHVISLVGKQSALMGSTPFPFFVVLLTKTRNGYCEVCLKEN